jgi:asparagine synthase (glutamine-hydrolysing)
LRHLVAQGARHVLSLDRADVLDRAAQAGELFWGGAIPFYNAHKRALFAHDPLMVSLSNPLMVSLSNHGRDAVDALYADVDAAMPGASQLDRMIGVELRQRLPELLLMRVDKVTMGSSLEARVPYLDHKLVEFALAVPADVKYRHGITKWVLKRVAERVGLDRELVYRSKRGFCGSASNMLSPRLLARAEEEILDSSFARARFDLGFIRKMFAEQHAGQVDHNFRLWNLWNLVAWHTCWLENPQPEPTAPAVVSV